MGPGEMNSVRGYRPHCWWEIYEIGGQSHLGKVPKWLKTLGPKADRVWAALEGVDPTILRELFTGRDRLYSMVSDLGRYYRSERDCTRIHYQESEEGRAQGRSKRPRRREQKRLAKAARKRRVIERRLQGSRQNSVEDSGPRVRGGRESTIGGALQDGAQGGAQGGILRQTSWQRRSRRQRPYHSGGARIQVTLLVGTLRDPRKALPRCPGKVKDQGTRGVLAPVGP